MSENVMDQIVAELRGSALELFAGHTELKNVRVVGHTPKPDHYTYDIVVDFTDASERVSAKVYRASKCGPAVAKQFAKTEFGNLSYVQKSFRACRVRWATSPRSARWSPRNSAACHCSPSS